MGDIVRGIFWAALSLVLLGGAAKAQPFLCPYFAGSATGDQLDGVDMETSRPSIGWHPKGTGGRGIEFVVGYLGSTTRFGTPSGGHAAIMFGEQPVPPGLTFELSDGAGLHWRPTVSQGNWSPHGRPDFRASVGFNDRSDEGRRMIASIVAGRKITVTVSSQTGPIATETFDTGHVLVRNALLNLLRDAAKKPPSCKTVSGPVILAPVEAPRP